VSDEPKLFTQIHSSVVVRVAQYLGARVLKEPFFPRWLVNQFAQAGLIEVERPIDEKTNKPSPKATVRVWSKDKSTSESTTVHVRLPKSPKES